MTEANITQNPTGSASLFFIQIFSTIAYSVLYVTLVLFSVQALHLPASQANHLMATFVAFNFALHLIGGFFGGRLISFRGLFLIGLILQTIGCFLISQITLSYFMLGMAFFIVGSGMDLPCINCMIAQLYQPTDKRREYAFLWNYSGMNIGFFIGVTIAGIFQSHQEFNFLFIFSSVTNVIAMLLLVKYWKKLRDVKTQLSNMPQSTVLRAVTGLILIGTIIALLQYILLHNLFNSEIILSLGSAMAIMIIAITLTRKNKTEKNKLIAYCLLGFASLIFYTLYELIPMALTLFLERNVDRHILGFTIPTAWFLNINTVIIIFGCPLLAYFTQQLRKNGYSIGMPSFFSVGLILIGIAIMILPIGIHLANTAGLVSLYFPALTYFLLALAEIALSPIGYALVSELAPSDLRGVLMGCWLMISGVAAILSNIFSNIALGPTQSLSPLISNISYASTFLLLGSIGIAAGVLLWVMRPLLLRLTTV